MRPPLPLESVVDPLITSFIAHVIDHRTGALGLSALETPVSSGFPHDFFKQYILYALADPLRRRACFRTPAGIISGAFSTVRARAQSFVDASQIIASHLHSVMGRSSYKRQIKPGDIMVALFDDAAQKGNGSPKYLAILKIDPSDAIIRKVVYVNGKQQVIFDARENRIPTAEENKIQKIALIGERQSEPEPHDLVILDNNIKQAGVAHFFYDDFLESRLNRDASYTSQFLLSEVKKFVSRKADLVTPILTAAERIRIVDDTAALLGRGAPVDLDTLAQQGVRLPGRPRGDVRTLREALVEYLASRGPAAQRIAPQQIVPVNPAVVANQMARITYVLDGGIEITGDADQIRERVQISLPDAAGNMTVTITTQTLGIN